MPDAPNMDDVTLGEVYRLVVRLDAKVDLLGQHYVPIELWRQRNEQVDDRFEAKGAEIAGLRAQLSEARKEAEARRPPWWSVLGSIAGVAAVVVSIIVAASRIGG